MGRTGAPAHPSSEGVRGLPGSTEHGGTGTHGLTRTSVQRHVCGG